MKKANSGESLTDWYDRARARVELLKGKIQEEAGIIRSAQNRKAELESDLVKAQQALKKLHELRIVEAGLPKDVLELRRSIRAKIDRSTSKDITVANLELLKEDIQADTTRLQELCEHPFVFDYDGYGGSQSYDFDDARHGSRICAICGFREQSESVDYDQYAVLSETPQRLIKRDLRENGVPKSDPRFFTVLAILDLFRNSAGSMNLDWPKDAGTAKTSSAKSGEK